MAGLPHGLILACVLMGAGCAVPGPDDARAGASEGARTVQPRGFLSTLAPAARPVPEDSGTRPRMPLPFARVPLAGGDVVVAAPDGYCIDPTSLDTGLARGFAVIASCRILSDGRAGGPVEPLIVTVTVGPRGEAEDLPDAAELADLADAPLIAGHSLPGFTAANLGGGGTKILDGGDDRYWRATFLQGGRLVGLALYAPAGSDMAGPAGHGMLRAVRDRVGPTAPDAQSAARVEPTPAAAGQTGNPGGVLRRLFGPRAQP